MEAVLDSAVQAREAADEQPQADRILSAKCEHQVMRGLELPSSIACQPSYICYHRAQRDPVTWCAAVLHERAVTRRHSCLQLRLAQLLQTAHAEMPQKRYYPALERCKTLLAMQLCSPLGSHGWEPSSTCRQASFQRAAASRGRPSTAAGARG